MRERFEINGFGELFVCNEYIREAKKVMITHLLLPIFKPGAGEDVSRVGDVQDGASGFAE